MWSIDSPYAISYWCPIWTEALPLTIFKIFASRYIWVTSLTFQGHMTSPDTWPFDTPDAISYRCSVVTESISPAIFEIIGPIHIGVTTLTFQNHQVADQWPCTEHDSHKLEEASLEVHNDTVLKWWCYITLPSCAMFKFNTGSPYIIQAGKLPPNAEAPVGSMCYRLGIITRLYAADRFITTHKTDNISSKCEQHIKVNS